MKKTIKLKFVGFWDGYDKPESIYIANIIKILDERYNLIYSEQPDYVICSTFGDPYEYLKYDCIRIMYCGENMVPDFNIIDYGIGHYRIKFDDRFFRLSQCFANVDETQNIRAKIFNIDELNKDKFCNFIYGHESENRVRERFFEKLSQYKRVDSAGTHLNNMPNGETVTMQEKFDLQSKCKFTIAFESTAHPGFCTEKIRHAFLAKTIPIYFGDKYANTIFNEKAFIQCYSEEDFDKVIELVKYLDNNDDAYLEYLNAPIYVEEMYLDKKQLELENFLYHIFDQPINQAMRRSRVYSAKFYNDALKDKFIAKEKENIFNKLMKRVLKNG